ncbi:MAG: hypothetical protein COV74_04165 [Candidatus Omnitrophica bacterium CG11_big_fil_rev_8_21_14_0_20_45_26]|uniref:Uncharacterized protein n=1 Tax=Candidatus Abzuiibacterium crystallinum TaxID=1974748 RepID=A0A2H0LQ68_9BACT|nr:MAG: hypothetical protein COV74_04165 [Candidatus Omnitrophica bacterium CG11_big_fil_rev_8_21_14_0_20_45_26]PIW63993.1 MAG: hypothetical protein COW12_08815 [Candidatus Omnitrophica bacterium CG12_big_fil_rev_8_21_14_0_65_45_16]
MPIKNPNRLITKAITLVVCVCFLATSTASYAQGIDIAHQVFSNDKPLGNEITIQIPSELGMIKEIHFSNSNKPLIIHIEDAHSQSDAQKKMELLLEHLKNTYDIRTLFLEGAFHGKVSPEWLQFFQDKALNQAVVNELFEKGEVTGPARFLLNQASDVKAFGVEEKTLYQEDLETFRQVYASRDSSRIFLKNFRLQLDKLMSNQFNPELHRFMKAWGWFRDDRAELMRHLNFLEDAARRYLKVDLTDGRYQLQFPQLVRFFKLKALEKERSAYSVERLEKEREKLFNWIQENQLNLFLEGFKTFLNFSTSSKSFLSAKRHPLSARSFLEQFYDQAAERGFTFQDYPRLSQRFAQIILVQELDAGSLFQEIDQLTQKLIRTLIQNPDEKKIITLFEDYLLIKKLLALELSRDELTQIRSRENELLPSKIAYRFCCGTGLDCKTCPDQNRYALLDTSYNQALRFYDLAEKREQAIVDNLAQTLDQQKLKKAVLITGGFHTKGLNQFFKDHAFSYVTIAPRIESIESNQGYLNHMLLNMPGESSIPYETPGLQMVSTMTTVGQKYFQQSLHEMRLSHPTAPAGSAFREHDLVEESVRSEFREDDRPQEAEESGDLTAKQIVRRIIQLDHQLANDQEDLDRELDMVTFHLSSLLKARLFDLGVIWGLVAIIVFSIYRFGPPNLAGGFHPWMIIAAAGASVGYLVAWVFGNLLYVIITRWYYQRYYRQKYFQPLTKEIRQLRSRLHALQEAQSRSELRSAEEDTKSAKRVIIAMRSIATGRLGWPVSRYVQDLHDAYKEIEAFIKQHQAIFDANESLRPLASHLPTVVEGIVGLSQTLSEFETKAKRIKTNASPKTVHRNAEALLKRADYLTQIAGVTTSLIRLEISMFDWASEDHELLRDFFQKIRRRLADATHAINTILHDRIELARGITEIGRVKGYGLAKKVMEDFYGHRSGEVREHVQFDISAFHDIDVRVPGGFERLRALFHAVLEALYEPNLLTSNAAISLKPVIAQQEDARLRARKLILEINPFTKNELPSHLEEAHFLAESLGVQLKLRIEMTETGSKAVAEIMFDRYPVKITRSLYETDPETRRLFLDVLLARDQENPDYEFNGVDVRVSPTKKVYFPDFLPGLELQRLKPALSSQKKPLQYVFKFGNREKFFEAFFDGQNNRIYFVPRKSTASNHEYFVFDMSYHGKSDPLRYYHHGRGFRVPFRIATLFRNGDYHTFGDELKMHRLHGALNEAINFNFVQRLYPHIQLISIDHVLEGFLADIWRRRANAMSHAPRADVIGFDRSESAGDNRYQPILLGEIGGHPINELAKKFMYGVRFLQGHQGFFPLHPKKFHIFVSKILSDAPMEESVLRLARIVARTIRQEGEGELYLDHIAGGKRFIFKLRDSRVVGEPQTVDLNETFSHIALEDLFLSLEDVRPGTFPAEEVQVRKSELRLSTTAAVAEEAAQKMIGIDMPPKMKKVIFSAIYPPSSLSPEHINQFGQLIYESTQSVTAVVQVPGQMDQPAFDQLVRGTITALLQNRQTHRVTFVIADDPKSFRREFGRVFNQVTHHLHIPVETRQNLNARIRFEASSEIEPLLLANQEVILVSNEQFKLDQVRPDHQLLIDRLADGSRLTAPEQIEALGSFVLGAFAMVLSKPGEQDYFTHDRHGRWQARSKSVLGLLNDISFQALEQRFMAHFA